MDLIDTHHRSVVRGYIMDREVFPELTPGEALTPYLDRKADVSATAAPITATASKNAWRMATQRQRSPSISPRQTRH